MDKKFKAVPLSLWLYVFISLLSMIADVIVFAGHTNVLFSLFEVALVMALLFKMPGSWEVVLGGTFFLLIMMLFVPGRAVCSAASAAPAA